MIVKSFGWNKVVVDKVRISRGINYEQTMKQSNGYILNIQWSTSSRPYGSTITTIIVKLNTHLCVFRLEQQQQQQKPIQNRPKLE